MSVLEPVAAIAATQHGCVHYDDLRRVPLTRGQTRTLVRNGVLLRRGGDVFTLVGSAATWRQNVMAEVLVGGPQCVASGRTASALWRLDRFREGPIDTLSPRWSRRRSGVGRHHETVDLRGCDRGVVDGIPVTSPTRTLIDMGRFVGVHRLGNMVDDAVRRELTSYEEVHRRFGELARSGRNGITTMRAVLDDRPGGSPTPGSPLEVRVRDLLVGAGIPTPVLQHPVRCDDLRFILDLAWPDRMVALECEGFAFHRTPNQLAWDEMRRNRLQLVGWTMLACTGTRVGHEPEAVVDEVRRALR